MMSFSYRVILRPMDVKFSCKEIPNKFDNGISLVDLKQDIIKGTVLAKDIPSIQVIWFCDKWEWYALNNRRLWVFQQLEKEGKLSYVAMSRVEMLDCDYAYPEALYKEVNLYEPSWDIRATNNNLKANSSCDKNVSLLHMSHLARAEGKDAHQQDTEIEKELSTLTLKDQETGDKVTPIDLTAVHDDDSDLNLPRSLINADGDELEITIKQEVNLDYEEASKEGPDHNDIDLHPPESGSNEPVSHDHENENKSSLSSAISVWTNTPHKDLDLYSGRSISSLTREQRTLSSTAGLYGYGYYHIYKSEYLDKLRCARSSAMKRYKPYDVEKGKIMSLSRCSSLTSVARSMEEKTLRRSSTTSRRSSRRSSPKVLNVSNYHSPAQHASKESLTEPRSSRSTSRSSVKRPKSPTPDCQSSRTKLDRDVNFSCKGKGRERGRSRMRLYSDDLGYSSHDHSQDTGSEKSCSFFSRAKQHGSSDSLFSRGYINWAVVPYERDRYDDIKDGGFKLSVMYAMWERRRAEYIELNGRHAIEYGSANWYLCGLCFKKFRHIVDLQQHSESLMHYACITCGRFFSSYASLGQHCHSARHKKD